MLSPADRMVEATMEYALRPRKNDREKLIAVVLEVLLDECSYTPWDFDKEIIDVKDIKDIIDELRSTVTLESPAH